MTQLLDDDLVAFAARAKGKVVFITGGGSGIGKDTALKFAQYGAKVSIADIDEQAAAAVADEITKLGSEAISTKCDITEWEQQVAAYEATISTFGSVDIVVANAGIPESDRLQSVKLVDGKPQKPPLKTIQVNLIGTIYTFHLAQHYLVQGTKGDLKAIVVLSSISAYAGAGAASYATAKLGIVGIVRNLMPFLAKDGIRLSILHPWFADTPMVKAALPILKGLPLTPIDRIARAVVRGATDPDLTTSACAYLLPDDGPVYQIEKNTLEKSIHPSLKNPIYQELVDRLAKAYGWTIY